NLNKLQLVQNAAARVLTKTRNLTILDDTVEVWYLLLAGLQVEGPERVMEGDKVTLTCKTTCRLTDRTSFTWYRNGAALSSRTEQLYLQSVSREDAGRYSCAVLDQNLHSPEVTLNIMLCEQWRIQCNQ
uniref:Ig-like domain-containing protein n=1 Tax=Astyanax mexicanus TaxID=7994 RepID=W5JZM3_ASTMX